MTIRLRPHHLLCLLTYVGRGYTPAFVENFDAIVSRLNGGEIVALVSGPDDLCAPLHGTADNHCLNAGVAARDAEAMVALEPVLRKVSTTAFRLDAFGLASLRLAFADGTIRAACRSCPWDALCTEIAQSGFAETRVRAC